MPLNERLRHIIDTKKIKKTEIAKKCNEIGVPVTDNYITKILNGSIKNPDIEKLEAIATALSVNKRLLVLENYFDNSPKEITDTLRLFLALCALYGSLMFEDIIKINTLEDIQEIIKNKPLSDFTLDFLNLKFEDFIINNDDITLKDEKDSFTVQLFKNFDISILDDSIEKLPKGNKIRFKKQKKYKDGDLIIFRLKNNNEKYLIRYLFIIDNVCYLKSTNSNYPTIKCSKKDIIIFGKVTELITKI